ncbi:MAG: sphingomyelin phosphodiesterase [Bacteroidetes bacterium]|nr:sphingomyelin phosphodiesterase [Bacteroidota bacterium]
MLPHLIAAGTFKKERATAIGNVLLSSDYDVVFFQEAFHPAARKRILSALEKQFPYHAGPANQKIFSLKANSGLWVFSRYPILKTQAITYRSRYGVDAMSRKGALLVELDIEGNRLQVAGTHLQNCGAPWIRQLQCVEFYERLLKPMTTDGVPQIICGDFNIDRYTNEKEYFSMLRALDARDLNVSEQYTYDRTNNDLRNEKGPRNDLIDYILIRNDSKSTEATNQVVRLKGRYNLKLSDLSDHYSLQAEIVFSNQLILSTVALSQKDQ